MADLTLPSTLDVTESQLSNPNNISNADIYKLCEIQMKSLNDLSVNLLEQRNAISDLTNRFGGVEEISASASARSSSALLKANNAISHIERMKQKLLNKSIEFSGVPYLENENLIELIVKILTILGISISPNDINSIFIIGRKTTLNARGEPSHLNIAVDFTREISRNSVLSAARTLRRPVTTTDINLTDVSFTKFFINERLTPYYRRIFNETLKYRHFKISRVGESTPLLTFEALEDIQKTLGLINLPSDPKTNNVVTKPVAATITPGLSGIQLPAKSIGGSSLVMPSPTSGLMPVNSNALRRSKRKTPDQREQSDDVPESDSDSEAKAPKIPRGPGRPTKKYPPKTNHAPPIPTEATGSTSDGIPVAAATSGSSVTVVQMMLMGTLKSFN